MRFVGTSIDIPTAGTQIQLTSNANFTTGDRILWIQFKARADSIFVGTSAVSSTDGFALENNEVLEFKPGEFGGSIEASTLWVDADTNGDDVDVAALLA